MKKIFLINILVFFCCLLFFYIILEITNVFVSGPPRYYELVYNFEKGDYRKKKRSSFTTKKIKAPMKKLILINMKLTCTTNQTLAVQ